MPLGKCEDCGVRWSWNGRPQVIEALCPACQRPLTTTSQNSLLPLHEARVTWNPIVGGPKYLTARWTEIFKLQKASQKRAARGPQ